MAAKIEVTMKKSEAMLWARLDLPPPVSPPKQDEKKKEESDSEDESDWWWIKTQTVCIFTSPRL